MRVSLLAVWLLVGPALASHSAPPQAAPILLHIGLQKHFARAQSLLLSSDSRFTVADAATGRALLHGTPGTVFHVTASATGLQVARDEAGGAAGALDRDEPVSVLAGPDDRLKIATDDGRQAPAWRHYRGTLTVRPDPGGTMTVINTVPLEAYLYGVIPAEIGADVPVEAMKAQAVAARTYALKNRGKFAAQGFDLDDTTRSEGYDGWDGETPASDAAVDATRGLVLAYHGGLIDAPYSTDSGGMTACDPTCPYLQAVRDSPGQDAPDYAADCKYHNWTLTYTPDDLQAALARDPLTAVDGLTAFALDGADASGRITTATVTAADGTTKTVTGTQLRRILGYDVLRSTLVTLKTLPNGDYEFHGKGWGHGLGMSQEGAVAMASPPYRRTYTEILHHYYVGTELTPAVAFADPPVKSAGASTHPRRGA